MQEVLAFKKYGTSVPSSSRVMTFPVIVKALVPKCFTERNVRPSGKAGDEISALQSRNTAISEQYLPPRLRPWGKLH